MKRKFSTCIAKFEMFWPFPCKLKLSTFKWFVISVRNAKPQKNSMLCIWAWKESALLQKRKEFLYAAKKNISTLFNHQPSDTCIQGQVIKVSIDLLQKRHESSMPLGFITIYYLIRLTILTTLCMISIIFNVFPQSTSWWILQCNVMHSILFSFSNPTKPVLFPTMAFAASVANTF